MNLFVLVEVVFVTLPGTLKAHPMIFLSSTCGSVLMCIADWGFVYSGVFIGRSETILAMMMIRQVSLGHSQPHKFQLENFYGTGFEGVDGTVPRSTIIGKLV